MTTHTRTITALIAEGTSNTTGSTQRGAADVRGCDAGMVFIKITNGGTGPTTQAEARIMIADTDSTTPATGAAGADWKTVVSGITPGTAANAVREFAWPFGPGQATHIQVEITGNTGQTVTCEAMVIKNVLS